MHNNMTHDFKHADRVHYMYHYNNCIIFSLKEYSVLVETVQYL